MHVRKGDQVVVVGGKEKGKRGRVLRLMTEAGRVVIERVAMVKRHTKPSQRNPRGGIVEKEGSVDSSNVALWCGKCGAPRRARVQEDAAQGADGKVQKRRVCVKCSTVFETA
jgi:large subunit ribosomal protein L24